MTHKMLALLAAAPLAFGFVGLAHADRIADTRISSHGATMNSTAPVYAPSYSTDDGTFNDERDTTRISAHEANPQNPGNTSNYNPAPVYVPSYGSTVGDGRASTRISAHDADPQNPGNTSNYSAPPVYVVTPLQAGPNVEVISNEPYFQDDVPPYRR